LAALTEKLYQEGIEAGRLKAQEVEQQAQTQAEAIVAQAKEQAEAILAQAKSDAAALEKQSLSALRMAGDRMVETLRGRLQGLLAGGIVKTNVAAAVADKDFLKSLLVEVAKSGLAGAGDLRAQLPAARKAELEQWLAAQLGQALAGSVTLEFTPGVGTGFKIGPKDGAFAVDFSQESLSAWLNENLKPATREILFGTQG